MAPQSNVYRRRQIDKARQRGESASQSALTSVLQARFKWLQRDLRKANLRKRLQKNNGRLYKAGDPSGSWSQWSAYFSETLKKSLEDGTNYLWTAEQQYFTSYGYDGYRVNTADVLADYALRDDTRITGISADTEDQVNVTIADWMNTDAGLPELIELLSQWFSPARAELIATTEMAYVASLIAVKQMSQYGIQYWQWDAFQDAVTCDICLDLMAQSKQTPFTISDPMPPDASHPRCVLPGQIVAAPNLSGGAKSFYEGVVVEITTRSGNRLTVTPNHPILTSRGWLPAIQLTEGMNVIAHLDPQRMFQTVSPNNQQRPALIENIFATLKMTPGMMSVTMKPAAKDFNGDAVSIQGEIDVVYPQRELGYRMQRFEIQQMPNVGFGGVQPSGVLDALRPSDLDDVGLLFAPQGGMSRLGLQSAFGDRHLAPFNSFSFALSASLNTVFEQGVFDNLSVNSPFLGEFLFRNAGLIKCDQVRDIRKYDFSGHVFDLSSDFYELYTCNNIITHNCRCGVYYVGVDVQ